MSSPLTALAAPFDHWLFLKINRDWTCACLDALMPVLTDLHKIAWFRWGVAPAAAALWYWREKRRALQVFVVAAVAVGAGDLLAYRAIKPRAERLRPEYSMVGVVKRAPTAGLYGFPSNHAVNAAAAASVLCVAYPAGAFVFAGVAFVLGYSRVYVGAHYPLDVLCGFALGAAIGLPWAWLILGAGGRGGAGKKKKR
jgi:undecaprenyl-diphosphatase